MALITPTELREHFETDLPDTAVQRVIDAEDAEIIRRHGSLDSALEIFDGTKGKYLFLSRPAQSIVSVTYTINDQVPLVLDASDYQLTNGQQLLRYNFGTNPMSYWDYRNEVTYIPRDDAAQRTMVLIDLCKLSLQYQAVQGQTVGDYQYAMYSDYQTQYNRILSKLRRGMWLG